MLAACSGAPKPVDTPADDIGATHLAAPTHSWWRIVDATSERSNVGGTIGLRDDGLVFFDPRGRFVWRTGTRDGDPLRPAWRLEQGPVRAVLIEEPDGRRARIELRGESSEPLVFTVEAETDDRARELDTLEQAARPPVDICPKAETCCREAVALIAPGTACDVDRLLGKPPQPDLCARAWTGLHEELATRNLAVPDGCR